MKKLTKITLSVLVILSCVLPYVNPLKVRALAKTYTYAYIDTDDLSTRTCPSTSCDRIRHDEGGIIWLNNPRVVEITEFIGDWVKVKYNYWGFTYEGYMYKGYLGGIKTVTLDENYANSLVAKGFPDSYVEKLTKMHAIHPNWNFEVSRVGTTLDDATNNEYSPLSKNLISTTNTSQLSTDPGAYNGSYIQFEPGWYAPSWQTLSYYLDARNFLDDNSIFMFEQLSYSDSQTEAIVQSLLNGTFMAGSYNYNGQNYTFARTFVEAGRTYGVSPVHLAARVLQEQGRNGSATTNMNSDGKTYHNYFNFNAYGSTTDQIVSNALSYAKRNGWDNEYKAIFGGAEEISDGYITNNQDTLFYQKFNLVGYYSKYSHQYMANIQAPYSEAYSSYYSYFDAGLIDSAFTFKIPVYDGMGSGTYIATKSNNNNLSSLNVSSCTLNPAFNSSISIYNCTVDNSVSSVTVTAAPADSKAKVSGTGVFNLNVGNNTVKVVVKAEDETEKTYTVTITRKEASSSQDSSSTVEPNTVIQSAGYKNSNNNLSGFTVGEDISGVINFLKSKNSSVTVKMYDANNKEITGGKISTGQKIVIKGSNEKTYNVVIYGDVNGDGKISAQDFSKIKSHILGSNNLNGAYSSAADSNKDGKISAQDFSKVKSHILGTTKLTQ
ncbi:MAG: cadherin-like beta sandwich domain-containing protein [Bacilli bacterium]|nr:cadherin-like beta sandwich domain-containing protein [Bacilli bacterium]